ncbi:MAG: hypothetical protein A3J67_00415 [Parcubacteria group bacterium RIFCSPHIGHO2_02_FULL_48_10b]|uniref:SAM-dependent methyltransferase n=1 Tax=Candidatus Wolfebacteria bacterium RIFCSPLOWO2_01_FULL_47_17b TaxID=1802558 RepID=A0A1F8E002_9BACT|nr:MAG: hypothetical protein A2935_01550 [Candidatus Wolfebacteria bacterium RIFCSPLOWO2_01_FULL_47_17b]OHB21841.1 MAG: hypothetical protein A3J67_00415 [Parcubacteria group bacterium RIFCSPHIGHO2_02_FULL_48_10b]
MKDPFHFLSHTSKICRNCGHPVLPFFSLGAMPLVNTFLRKEDIPLEKRFDLTVGFCSSCFLTQLMITLSPEVLFRDYVYFSSVSSSFLSHCKKTAREFIKRFDLGKENLVLEIASNDGALLRYFQEQGIGVLGIEPAKNVAEAAKTQGIPTIPEFFNYAFARKLKEEQKVSADLVIGMNVLAHVPEISDFLKGVSYILKPQGTAVFEFPYIEGLFEGKFDTIYHEHVFYFSLLALQNVFKNAGLEIYDLSMTPMQGGSLMIFAAKDGVFSVNARVRTFAKRESKYGYDKLATYRSIAGRAQKNKTELLALLKNLKKEGKKVIAYSVPAKGIVLLNYCGIGENYLAFSVDKSPAKQGLYTPGVHLLVHPLAQIYKEKPDYLLILCWNIADEVMAMEELKPFRDRGGKFIVAVPKVKIY